MSLCFALCNYALVFMKHGIEPFREDAFSQLVLYFACFIIF